MQADLFEMDRVVKVDWLHSNFEELTPLLGAEGSRDPFATATVKDGYGILTITFDLWSTFEWKGAVTQSWHIEARGQRASSTGYLSLFPSFENASLDSVRHFFEHFVLSYDACKLHSSGNQTSEF